MLKKVDYKSSIKSIYICDRCGEVIDYTNKNSIHVAEHKKHLVKKWDLCDRCYLLLRRGIAKGQAK